MDKVDFARGKRVVSVEWWLDECALPSLVWARLRVYTDVIVSPPTSEGTEIKR